jgi:hypothetical protein
MSDDSDSEEPPATKAGKRSATIKKPPKSAKKSKSNTDGKKAAKLSTVKQKKVSTAEDFFALFGGFPMRTKSLWGSYVPKA